MPARKRDKSSEPIRETPKNPATGEGLHQRRPQRSFWQAEPENSSGAGPTMAAAPRFRDLAFRLGHDEAVIGLVAMLAVVEAVDLFFRRNTQTDDCLDDEPSHGRDDQRIDADRRDSLE